jgi:hypothetical protein
VQLIKNCQEAMVRIDGKYKLVIWAAITVTMQQLYAASLELRVQDVHGHRVNQIAVGQPFGVSVMIQGTDGKDVQPVIRTRPTAALQRAGQNMTISGKDSIAIQNIYRGRIDVPGAYTIGPATIVYQGNTISSNVVTLEVTDQPLGSVRSGRDDKQDVFFELTTEARTAVVGQKIPIALTFYYRDKSVRAINVEQPASEQFTFKGNEHGVFSTQELQGVNYNVIRWDCYIIPQNSGRIVIPAHCIDYDVEKRSGGRYNPLSFFFDSGYERKRAYSNAVTVTVDPLPSHRGPVLAIGVFESAKLTLEPSVAQEGQALVLSLDITGDTEWDAVKSPELSGLPDGLRCYDSKQYMRQDHKATTLQAKRFEYVVQGVQPGKWHIPPQEFTVFDVSQRKYKTLRTEGVLVTIGKNSTVSAIRNIDKKDAVPAVVSDKPDLVQDDLLPINQQGPWSSIPGHAPIAMWLFIILALLPLVCIAVRRGYERWLVYRVSRIARYRSRRAFVIARHAIRQAQKSNDVCALYYIFIQLFADYYCVDRGQVSQLFMEHTLTACAVSDHLRAQWQEFFLKLSSYVFGTHNKVTSQHLFTSAGAWVDLWEKVL